MASILARVAQFPSDLKYAFSPKHREMAWRSLTTGKNLERGKLLTAVIGAATIASWGAYYYNYLSYPLPIVFTCTASGLLKIYGNHLLNLPFPTLRT